MKRALISLIPMAVGLFTATFFIVSARDLPASFVFAMVAVPTAAVLALTQAPAFREKPAMAGGFIGLLVFVPLALRGQGAAWLSPFAAIAAGLVFERLSVMMPPQPQQGPRLGLLIAALLACFGAFTVTSTPTPTVSHQSLGDVEVPALRAATRDRLGNIEIFTEPSGVGFVSVGIGAPSPHSDVMCLASLPPLGRTLHVEASETEVIVGWPISPHGEVNGECAFDRATGALTRNHPQPISRAVERRPLFAFAFLTALVAALMGARLRKQHARIARSPEVEANAQGVVSMPDGSLAVLKTPLHPARETAATLVALSISDRAPGATTEASAYRTDARVIIEAWELGKKSQILPALARRIRTVELVGAAAAIFATTVAALVH
jgi:hypothetical protein